MRTTEEALLAVSDSYREASFGVGAGKLRTVFKIVLPAAMPGILSGVILAIGRIVGETAALIYTAGTVAGGFKRTSVIGAYTCNTYVCTVKRGLVHKSSICNGGCIVDICVDN